MSNLDPSAWAVLATACFTGIGNIIAIILASRKASKDSAKLADRQQVVAKTLVESQDKVAATLAENHGVEEQGRGVLHDQISDLATTTDKIHVLADGNLSALNTKLEEANQKIEALTGGFGPNAEALNGISAKLDILSSEMAIIRERQHDLADFIHKNGLAFDLKNIPGKT